MGLGRAPRTKCLEWDTYASRDHRPLQTISSIAICHIGGLNVEIPDTARTRLGSSGFQPASSSKLEGFPSHELLIESPEYRL